MSILFIFFWIELCVYVTEASGNINQIFMKDKTFCDLKISDGILATKTAIQNKAVCAFTCNGHNGCVSFFYNSADKTCQLNSVIYLSTDGSEPTSGVVYYRQQLGKK